ncbi:ABC-2 family transporter protein [bacterium BMS3Bbin04]|nr:ABC-2 family transporter protein [bacterium BMS3Bbin04]
MNGIILIAKQEFLINLRNRWVLTFSAVFTLLTMLIAFLGMVTSGYVGIQDFIRTAASLVNLSGFLLPLFALIVGVFSFLSHRQYMEFLVVQPISRDQVLLGKFLGLVMTVFTASILGFGLPGVITAINVGTEGALRYLEVVLNSLLLSVVFAGLSVLISLIASRRQVAFGIALGVWLFFEVLFGTLMLGSTLYFTPSALKTILLIGLLLNPIDITRVLSLLAVGGPHLFGPAGATLIKMTGSETIATMIGYSSFSAWIVLPILASIFIFRKQDI